MPTIGSIKSLPAEQINFLLVCFEVGVSKVDFEEVSKAYKRKYNHNLSVSAVMQRFGRLKKLKGMAAEKNGDMKMSATDNNPKHAQPSRPKSESPESPKAKKVKMECKMEHQ